jgi:hypothetical protein
MGGLETVRRPSGRPARLPSVVQDRRGLFLALASARIVRNPALEGGEGS